MILVIRYYFTVWPLDIFVNLKGPRPLNYKKNHFPFYCSSCRGMKSVILAAVVSFLVNIVGRKILVIECEVLFYRSNKYKC